MCVFLDRGTHTYNIDFGKLEVGGTGTLTTKDCTFFFNSGTSIQSAQRFTF